jgi:hypothetical protein
MSDIYVDGPDDWLLVRDHKFDPDGGDGRQHEFLGSVEQAPCRFCLRSAAEATFRKDAHVIPVGLGNRHLLHREECDDCNEVGGTFEDALCSLLALGRIFSRIRGRKGPMKHRFGKSRSFLQSDPDANKIIVVREADENTIAWRWTNSSVIYTIQCPSYRPVFAVKALARMALFLAREEDMPRLAHVRDWLSGRTRWAPIRFHRAFIPGTGKVNIRLALHLHALSPHYRVTLEYNNDVVVFHIPDSRGQVQNPPILPYLELSPYPPHVAEWTATTLVRDELVRNRFEDLEIHVPALASAPPLEEDTIRAAAYLAYLDRTKSGAVGDPQLDWLKAEQELLTTRAARLGLYAPEPDPLNATT